MIERGQTRVKRSSRKEEICFLYLVFFLLSVLVLRIFGSSQYVNRVCRSVGGLHHFVQNSHEATKTDHQLVFLLARCRTTVTRVRPSCRLLQMSLGAATESRSIANALTTGGAFLMFAGISLVGAP